MLALHEGCEDTDGDVHARVGVAECGAALRGHVVVTLPPSGGGSRACGNLGHWLVSLQMGVFRTYREALDGGVDATGIDLVDILPAEAELVHRSRMEVLDEYVGSFDQLREYSLAVGCRGVESERLLVAVELQEVVARTVGSELNLVTRGIAGAGTLDLYDVGAEPCEKLSTRRAGLHVGEVDHLDSLKRCCVHSILVLECLFSVFFPFNIFNAPTRKDVYTDVIYLRAVPSTPYLLIS